MGVVISALRRLRQEDYCKFKDNLVSIVSSVQPDPVKKEERKKEKKRRKCMRAEGVSQPQGTYLGCQRFWVSPPALLHCQTEGR